MAHVALDGDDTAGEDEGNILVGEHAALVDGFVGDADDLVLPQTMKPGLLVDREVFLGVVQRQLDGDLLAEGNGLAGGLVLIDGQVLTLTRAELKLGMLKEVITDLREVRFCQDRGEVEIPGDARDDRLLDRLRLKSSGERLIQHMIPPAKRY